MKRLIPAAMLAVLLLLPSAIMAAAQSAQPLNAQRVLQWLQCVQQQGNGQIGNGGNPVARSSEVALGLAAAGQPASAMHSGAASLADYLKTATSTDVGTNGELLLARVSQPGTGPTATVALQLQASASTSGPTAGEYGADIFSDAYAILGLRADEQPLSVDAISFLKRQQKSDGGWSFDNADQFGTDSNTTALVIQALISAGVAPDDAAIDNAFKYLETVSGPGGFEDSPGSGPDPNSNELVSQAIVAAGRQTADPWRALLDQSLKSLDDQQIASGADAGAIASAFSKLFASTDAPAVFLLSPLTQTGVAKTTVPLLACPAASAATPAPTATATPRPPIAARLAQTGSSQPPWQLLLGLLTVLGGLAVHRRFASRVPYR